MKFRINDSAQILFIISTITISNQIVLMQYFAYQQWYHFASIIISMVLIGFGLSGLLIPVVRKYFSESLEHAIDSNLLLLSFNSPLSLIVAQHIIGQFDSYLIFYDLIQNIKFFLIILNFTVTFLILALLIGLIFSVYPEFINRLYFLNLFGSALGGYLSIVLLWTFLPQQIVVLNGFIISLFLVFRANFFSLKFSLIKSLILFAIILNGYFIFNPVENHPSQFKTISRLRQLSDAEIIYSKNSPYGRIEKLKSKVLRYSPGLSLKFIDEIPAGDLILLNGEVYGFELRNISEKNKLFLKQSTLFLPYELKKNLNVLILTPSGGIELHRAIVGNSKKITAIELNPVMMRLLREQFARNEIILLQKNPRAFIEQKNSKFDLIFHSAIEPVGYSSGLFSSQEKYLLTIEAFQKIYESLADGGYFSISCYIDNPLRSSLKLLNQLMRVRTETGQFIKPEQLLAIYNWNVITFILKKGEFYENELSNARKFCEENQFDFLIIHGKIVGKAEFNHIFDSTALQNLLKSLYREQNLIDDFIFNISPSDDDKPYFSNFISLNKIREYINQISLKNLSYIELGSFILISGLLLGIIFAVILLSLGWTKINTTNKLKLNSSIYFALIGMSFMIIELSLFQKFTLIFANDVYSITFVISVLLISTGIGSLFSKKLIIKVPLLAIFSILFVVIIAYSISFGLLSKFIIVQSDFIKYITSGILIFIPGFMMGIPFPAGIAYYSKIDKNVVPFAWLVNGSFSVIGSTGTVLSLMNFGFSKSLIIAGILYLSCGIFAHILKMHKN